jgi:hypothetical protein
VARVQALTIAFCAGRIAFGVALLARPSRIGTSWLGADARGLPTQAALRGLGARDLSLAGGTTWAAARGGAARPWLIATIAGDLGDVAATLAAGDAVPRRARAGTVALAGGSALAGALLAWRSDG